MKKILGIISLIFVLTGFAQQARAEEGNYEWMDSTLDGILNFISGCIEVPKIANMVYSSKVLDLTQSEKWVATGIYVQDGKLLQIEWDLRGVEPRPEKYLVLYRIDPRFKSPQVFIQEYDYKDEKYIADFYQFKNGQLLKYQETPEMVFPTRTQDYLDYFNFVSRSKIPVKINDVINITLDKPGQYFAGNAKMNSELNGPLSESAILYTESASMNNKIIYSALTPWCNAISNLGCSPGGYINSIDVWGGLVGAPINSSFNLIKSSLPSCPDGANTKANTTLCKYDKGRGMKLQVGAKTIKPTSESFITSPFTNKDFFYYKSDTAGDLNFVTDWQIDGMFSGGLSQFMDSWAGFADYYVFKAYLNTLASTTFMNYLHFGRYEMEIEIGNAETVVNPDQLRDIKVEYVIMGNGTPTGATSGNEADMEYKTNANDSGYLWLRVINPNSNIGGGINVKVANYTGSTWFSDIIYGKLVKPLREKFNELTKQVYTKLVTNSMLQNVARGMLTLYVMIYGLTYLAGATQISAIDLVTRILKVIIILILFSDKSWNFFNDNVFTIFIDGTDYLLSSVVGVTSQVGNIFGFVDPVFDKYTNGTIWGLLFIQLLMIHNGMCFFAIITIYSIILYFRALLEVIISYCLAFLGLAIMVSLAPIFITFLLFEQTKNMFNSWISTMFSYMMQPTILLIFFLLIDQLMGEHITKTVARACWDILIPIEIGVDLHFMGIPLSFSFTLPFLPGIPFYVGQIHEVNSIDDLLGRNDGTFLVIATSSLLFYAYSKLAYGLVDYVTIVVQNLTNVVAARQAGRLQDNVSPVQGIIGDMKSVASPVTDRLEQLAGFIKRKAIDQKIDHREQGSRSSSSSSLAKTDAGTSSSNTNNSDTPSSDTIRQGGGKAGWKTTAPSASNKPADAKVTSLGGARTTRQASNTSVVQKSSDTKSGVATASTNSGEKPKAPKPLPKPSGFTERMASAKSGTSNASSEASSAAAPKAPKPLPKSPRYAQKMADLRAKMAETNTPKVEGTDINRDFNERTPWTAATPSWSSNWPSEGDNKVGDKATDKVPDTNERTEMNLKESQKDKDNIQAEKPKQDKVSDKPVWEKDLAKPAPKPLPKPAARTSQSNTMDKPGTTGQTSKPQPIEKKVSRQSPTAKPINKDGNKNE